MRAVPRVTAACVGALLLLAALPLAGAHCVPGTDAHLFEEASLPSTCPLNEDLEALSAGIADATDHRLAVVFVKDYTFHPNAVAVRSGGSVLFAYADMDSNQIHDPRSSGPCQGGVDAAADPEACVPGVAAGCFDVVQDQGDVLRALGDDYPLTFRYAPSTGLLEKSRGILSGTPGLGEPPFAQPFRACPAGSGANSPAQTVIAYHCSLHGAAGTARQTMRGAITVLA